MTYIKESNECPTGYERRRVGFGTRAHLVPVGKLQSICGLSDNMWAIGKTYGQVGDNWPTCLHCLRKLHAEVQP